jgi:hypothetical protein
VRKNIFFSLSFFYLFLFPNFAVGMSIESYPSSIKECPGIENFYKRANCIEKILSSSTSQKEKEELFEMLINYWINRDGSQGYTLSDIFLDLLESHPDFFFSQMSKHRESFEEWLNRLRYLSFTWHEAPPSPLPEKKKKILRLLENYKPQKKELIELKETLLNKMISIKPRQIQ